MRATKVFPSREPLLDRAADVLIYLEAGNVWFMPGVFRFDVDVPFGHRQVIPKGIVQVMAPVEVLPLQPPEVPAPVTPWIFYPDPPEPVKIEPANTITWPGREYSWAKQILPNAVPERAAPIAPLRSLPQPSEPESRLAQAFFAEHPESCLLGLNAAEIFELARRRARHLPEHKHTLVSAQLASISAHRSLMWARSRFSEKSYEFRSAERVHTRAQARYAKFKRG